jgi:maleate cis-trans isomerase
LHGRIEFALEAGTRMTHGRMRPIKMGVIYPDTGAEDEYENYAVSPPFPLEIRIAFSVAADSHLLADLIDTASIERLLVAALELKPWKPDVVTWACTSGSFAVGVDGARRQVEAILAETGVPAGSTSLAFGEAAHHLGYRKVAVLASYPPFEARKFVEFLTDLGLDVVNMRALNCLTTSSATRLTDETLLAEAAAVDVPEAEAFLLPDTALHSLPLLEPLAAVLRKPVLSANQVTIWQALRLTGARLRDPRLGVLADVEPAASPA